MPDLDLALIAHDVALDALDEAVNDRIGLDAALKSRMVADPDGGLAELLAEHLRMIHEQLASQAGTQWLVWSNKHGMWWRPDERDYTSRIDEAGRYSREQADRIVAKQTCDGQLVYHREDPVTRRPYDAVDEVAVPAP